MVQDGRSKEGSVEAALSVRRCVDGYLGLTMATPCGAGQAGWGAARLPPPGPGSVLGAPGTRPGPGHSHTLPTPPSVAGEASGQSEERSKTETMGPRKEET